MMPLYWTIGAFAGALAIHMLVKHWPRSKRARFLHDYAALQRDMDARGLTDEQRSQEFTFRYYMAAFRDELSDAVVADPANYRQKMADLAIEKAKTIAVIDSGVAKRFVKVVDGSPLSDLLHTDALAVLDRWLADRTAGGMDEATLSKALGAVRTI